MFKMSMTNRSLCMAVLSLLVGCHLCLVSALFPFDVDVDDLSTGLAQFKTEAAKFTPAEASDALGTVVPLIGKSFNELIGGGVGKKASELLDLVGFVQYAKENNANFPVNQYNVTELTAVLTDYLFVGAVESLTAASAGVCSETNPVGIQKISNVLSITFCVTRKFERSTEFNAKGLFDVLDGFVEIDTTASGTTSLYASLSFSATLEIDLDDPSNSNSITINIEPLVGELLVDAEVDFVVALGMLDVSTTAAVESYARVEIVNCVPSGCDGEDPRAVFSGEDPILYLTRTANFSLTGEITLDADFPGVNITGATLTITDANVFDELTLPQVSIPSFDFLNAFQDFSPTQAVRLLTVVDAALVRAQENPAFNVNLPITQKRFSDLLATGSVITSKLLEYFVIPEPFEDRSAKSLLILSEGFANGKGLEFNATHTKELSLFIFTKVGEELKTNPDNYNELLKDTGVTKCPFTLNETPEDAEAFAELLREGINIVCGPDFACAKNDCPQDSNGDFGSCNCDVVVDDDEGNVFIATVASKDVHLVGLFDANKANFTGPGELFSFPLNQAVTPGLIPRFRNFKDFTDKIEEVVETRFDGVTLDFTYNGDVEPARFEVDLGFKADFSANASIDTSVELGDLARISIEEGVLLANASITFGAQFGVILGPEDSETITLVGSSCFGAGFDDCTAPAVPNDYVGDYVVKLSYTVAGETTSLDLNLTGDGSKKPFEVLDAALTGALAAKDQPSDRITVKKNGTALLVITFDSSVSEYVITVPKYCSTPPAKKEDKEAIVEEYEYKCSRGLTGYVYDNGFGFVDAILTKKKFQLAVGEISLVGELGAFGSVDISAAVGEVIEVNAALDASITGSVALSAGDGFLNVADWVIALTKIFSDPLSEGHIPGFLSATATFNGDFTADVTASKPFPAELPDAKGEFSNFEINFLDLNTSKVPPNVTFEIDLPNIGNVRNMSFEDVIKLLQLALEFLVGDPEVHSVESCSGGLLGLDVGGKKVFTYELPVFGFSVCDSAAFLQVVVDAVAELTGVNDSNSTTFSALENKLESLLQDGVGGEPSVNIASSAPTDSTFADLTIELVLSWSFEETKALGLDLADLLKDVSADGVEVFQNALLPPEGGAEIELEGKLSVTLALGLEYNNETEKVTPYLMGTTGFEASFWADGEIEFEAAIGPLTGTVEATFDAGTEANPLALRAGLDETKRYYLQNPNTVTTRDAFFYLDGGIGGILGEVDATFSGAAGATVTAKIPLIFASAEFTIIIPDVNEVFKGTEGAIQVVPDITAGIGKPSFLDILLSDPQAIVDALDNVLKTAEAASLGPRGIITTFDVPFDKDLISKPLKAGTPFNALAEVRQSLIPMMQETLNKYEIGDDDTVADLLGKVITDLLQDLNLMDEMSKVDVECFYYNESNMEQTNIACTDDGAKSVQWTVPLGESYSVDIPLDFSIGDDLPMKLSMSGEESPTLSFSWEFNLAFGFDEDQGFFLQTIAAGDAPEMSIRALLDVPEREINADLFFLEATVKGFCVQIGAAVNVDIDKASALRLDGAEPAGPSFGRITSAEMKKIVKISEMFEIKAIAGAAVLIGENTEVAASSQLGSVADWIPKLNFGAAAQFRQELSFGVSRTRRRRLSSNEGYENLLSSQERLSLISPPIGSPHRVLYESKHPALPLLRSLGSIGDGGYGNVNTEGFGPAFTPCQVEDGDGFKSCAKVTNLRLNVEKIKEVVKPILDKIVNEENDGYLDKPVQPMLELNKVIQALKKLTGQSFTTLDIAEIYLGKKSGVDTVRKIIEIYEKIKEFANSFSDTGDIIIAEECDILAGFDCCGGLKPNACPGSRLLAEQEHMEFLLAVGAGAGLDVSPVEATHHRNLADCDSDCGGCSMAKRVACKARNVQGLSFPPLADPLMLIDLLKGDDIPLIEFVPPVVEFAFDYELIITLYTPPTVNLEIGFGFTAELKLGFVLDSKGIREAVQQKCPIKALNSFALMDTFDGIDEPMIRLTGTIRLEVSVSAVIVKISVYGGVTFVATIDLFDPFPEDSGGLVRPFELLALGSTPIDWFEFGLEIYVNFGVSISIGLFLGPFEITLWSYKYEVSIALIDPLLWQPDPIKHIATLDGATGDLELTTKFEEFLCTRTSGSLGQEEIECLAGKNKATRLIKSWSPVKTISTDGGAISKAEFQDIESNTTLKAVGQLILDYSDTQYVEIFVSGGGVLAGPAARVDFDSISSGLIRLPKQPEVTLLVTTIKDCSDTWTLEGHTNLKIKGSEIRPGCVITANGGSFNTARLIIDFSDLADGCSDSDNSVKLRSDGPNDKVLADVTNKYGTVTVTVASVFTDVEIYMSQCDDMVNVESTLETSTSVLINGRNGTDSIFIGPNGGGYEGLDDLHGDFIVKGGNGDDMLQVLDTLSPKPKDGNLTSYSITGLMGTYLNDTIFYEDFKEVTISLSAGVNKFLVTSTAPGSETLIDAQDANDIITVNDTQGYLELRGGGGGDTFYIYGMGDNTEAAVYGEGGNDTLWVDGTGNPSTLSNTLDFTRIRWSGGDDDDTINAVFASTGTSNIDLFDDTDGINLLNIDCADFACYVLSRENFIANIHAPEFSNSSTERINIDRVENSSEPTGWSPTVSIDSIFMRLNGGLNKMYFDDTIGTMDVFGGTERDEFRIGQLYNSERDSIHNVQVADPVETTLTTQGYLSNGCSHPITLNGNFGNDLFDVVRNKQVVDLNGESGNDTFVVRSFIALVIDEDGNILTSDSEKVTALGGDDDDDFDIKGDGNQTNNDLEPFNVKGEDPDYVVNSLVDIDGGTGTDTLFVSGTEQDDSYVVTDGAVYGGGLSVKFANIESLQVDCQAGNDLVSVLSTSPGLSTVLYGNIGSDTFNITPREVGPVTSRNLRGHRGILEHEISSNDLGYGGLLVEGVAVDILDNDGKRGYVNFVQNEAVSLLFEDDPLHTFYFTVYPTRPPNSILVVDIVAQSDIEKKGYMTLNNKDTRAIELMFTDMTPQVVTVKYNTAAAKLNITDVNLIIKSVVDTTKSGDVNFKNTSQSITPIDVKLIPSKDSEFAKSVTVIEPTGKTIVAEGENGFDATYDIYLRPCTEDMRSGVVRITPSVENQVELSHNTITGNEWCGGFDCMGAADDCKVTVTVSALTDGKQEGDHFVTLRHVAEDAGGNDIILSDDSVLYVSNVLVRIYDEDIAGIVIDESLGYTATAEIDSTEVPVGFESSPELFADSYRIRLSKEPTADVAITVKSIATATDRLTPSTMDLDRDYTERIQVELGAGKAESIELVFTPGNWAEWQTVNVYAKDDDQEEGVDLLYFPSQPSFLSFIQGPIRVVGEGKADIPQLEDPLMLPYETDDATFSPDFELPSNGTLYVIEAKQVDRLIIHNTDVRGNEPTVGNLTKTQLVGMNMATNIVINGEAQLDGITYEEMEVIEIYLSNGVDDLSILDTSYAMHMIDLGGGDDEVLVQDISGPVLIHGRNGSDVVTVNSEEDKLDKIQALLAFDGGDEDEGVDELVLNDSGDDNSDYILNVTRFIVESPSMQFGNSSNMSVSVSYLLNFRGAEGGNFTLEVYDPVEDKSRSRSLFYPLSSDKYYAATLMESAIQHLIIPEEDELDTCGELNTSKCSNAVKVWAVADDAFAVFFAGERLGEDMVLNLYTDALTSFDEEWFLNRTNDIIQQNSDVCYSNLELLNITTGGLDHVVLNVRGTSAKSMTTVNTQNGDDYVFISNEANENISSSVTIDHLLGWLDYVEYDLTINTKLGRHRLLMSDENSTIVKGRISVDVAMKLTNNSLTDIHENVGDIYYNTDGNWSAGVDLWLGEGADRLDVLSVPSNPGGAPFRTSTSVHAGLGDDELTVSLDTNDHNGVVFIANGQYGNDTINCSSSTHPVILFGDRGNDTLIGGQGSDVIFGDLGRVHWRDYSISSEGTVVARAGGGGFGDFKDGIIRNISELFSVFQEVGGNDTIDTLDGDNVVIGGVAGDTITGGNERDIIFGDSGIVTFFPESNFPHKLISENCTLGGPDTIHGGDGEVDYLIGGTYNDTINGNDGMDLVFGDHAAIELNESISHQLVYATTIDHGCGGGADTIDLGAGDDIAFGAQFSDTIRGGPGQDIIFGDFGEYDANTEFLPYQNYRPIISTPEYGDGDYLYGDDGDDILFGQEGTDTIDGGKGNDDIIGGHSRRFGQDTGDELYGGDDDDVILGDNGQILRIRISDSGTYPWVNGSVWFTYPEPFADSVVRNVSRYDDIDYVQGDDIIRGGAGNDVLHGQRGDDEIYGDEGDDELHGELGADKLYAGAGNDILIGDIGYCVRRYDSNGSPILQSDVGGTASSAVWHKDIVLEELGNITKVSRISKKVDKAALSAEETTSASLLFVANAIDAGGGKYIENDEWPTDLFLFNLVESYNDTLDAGGGGSNVLIGQRGDDTLLGGNYSDLLIGDAGQNLIPQNTDLPRIYQVYRTLSAPVGSGYEVGPNAVDFGVVFTADFELYPRQYRYVDYLQSFIDIGTTLNDVQESSDLIKDIIGASTLATDKGYCMQAMFRITPGFVHDTQKLHGNDIIQSGSGDSIVIGDDIRGATPFDLTQLAEVDDLRQDLDNLVYDLSYRLSTMEVDTGFYLDSKAQSFVPLKVGCDTITTDPNGHAFVTGDSLTMFGRSLLGGFLSDPETQVAAIVNRLRDIELVLIDVHLAMYELHTALLRKMQEDFPNDLTDGQESQYNLTLSSDTITSYGDNDILIGDSAVLFTQAIREGMPGFEFHEFSQSIKQDLSSMLRTLTTARDDARDAHVLNDVFPTVGLTNTEQNRLALADVPFLLQACSDTLYQNTANNLGVGDYGLVGFVTSETPVSAADTRKDLYADSMESIRKRPAVSSFFAGLTVLSTKIPFYEARYDSQVTKDVEPSLFGDFFFGESIDNAMLGDFMTGIGYGDTSVPASFVFDEKTRGVFDTFDNADMAIVVDGDTFDVFPGTPVEGQKGKDIFVPDGGNDNGQMDVPVEDSIKQLFYNHSLIIQWVKDIHDAPVFSSTFTVDGIKPAECAADPVVSSFIPPDIFGGPSTVGTSIAAPAVIATSIPTAPPTSGPTTSKPTTLAPTTEAPVGNAGVSPAGVCEIDGNECGSAYNGYWMKKVNKNGKCTAQKCAYFISFDLKLGWECGCCGPCPANRFLEEQEVDSKMVRSDTFLRGMH